MNKKGLTLFSMVIYVALFFAFMAFATAISSTMNYTALSYKGRAINEECIQKLQFNITSSAKESTSIAKLETGTSSESDKYFAFSNNDEYRYDHNRKQVLKNGGVIATNVTEFDVVDISNLKDVPFEYFRKNEKGEYTNLDMSKDYVCINVTIDKYNIQTTSQIIAVVGDGIYE